MYVCTCLYVLYIAYLKAELVQVIMEWPEWVGPQYPTNQLQHHVQTAFDRASRYMLFTAGVATTICTCLYVLSVHMYDYICMHTCMCH